MNWKNAVKPIRVPLRNGHAKFGTAFLVEQDLLMTARHVACPKERDGTRRIQVNWGDHDTPDWLDLAEDDPVVWVCETHDVALLRIARLDGKADICALNLKRPANGTRWEGEGFPRDGEKDGHRKAVSFGGIAHDKADGTPYFEIVVEGGAPTNEGGWAGASGMPIMAAGWVIGVCLEVPDNFRSERLKAAPLWQLWNKGDCHSPLREHFLEDAVYNELRGQMVRAMTGFAGAEKEFKAFARALGFTDRLPAKPSERDKAAVVAVDAVLASPVQDVLKALKTAQDEIRRQGGGGVQGGVCPRISGLVRDIAPLVFRITGPTAQWMEQAARQGGGIVASPFATMTMAEVMVSTARGQPLDFHDRRHVDDDLPIGRNLLPLAPVFGDGRTDNRILTMVIQEARDLLDIPPVDPDRAYDLSIVDALNVKAGAESTTRDLAELAAYFRNRVEYGEPVPYLAIVQPEDEAPRRLLGDAIRRLTDPVTGIPDLFVILLDGRARAADRKALGGIPYFIPIVSPTPERSPDDAFRGR